MRDPFAGYDAWLERPYQDMMEETDRFIDWCDENELDPEDDEVEASYQEWIEAQYEGAAEAQAEAYLDRMEYEAHEEDEYLDRW